MQFGYWMPVFGGWLRNVEDENMEASWDYIKKLAVRAEEIGFDISLIAELNLNDIKGEEEPSVEAWALASALAAVTQKQELMVAVRPTFHNPALFAKQAATIDHISGGRLSLNVVSAWWKEEARKFGIQFDEHDDRYGRTAEWLSIVDKLWKEDNVNFEGKYYEVHNTIVQPKPISKPRPFVYAGGESDKAKATISEYCDGYVMHGDGPETIAARINDMKERREKLGLSPMKYGVAAFSVIRNTEEEVKKELSRITDVKATASGFRNYQQWVENTQLEAAVSIQDYSVSNRGLRTKLTGTPQQVIDRIGEYEKVGVDFFLLQCSPQLEEMERFSENIIQVLSPA